MEIHKKQNPNVENEGAINKNDDENQEDTEEELALYTLNLES